MSRIGEQRLGRPGQNSGHQLANVARTSIIIMHIFESGQGVWQLYSVVAAVLRFVCQIYRFLIKIIPSESIKWWTGVWSVFHLIFGFPVGVALHFPPSCMGREWRCTCESPRRHVHLFLAILFIYCILGMSRALLNWDIYASALFIIYGSDSPTGTELMEN